MGGGGGNVPQESRVFNQAFPELPRNTLNRISGATGMDFDPFRPLQSYGFGGTPTPQFPGTAQQSQIIKNVLRVMGPGGTGMANTGPRQETPQAKGGGK